MAYSFASASSQYLNTTTSPISDVPLTLSIFTIESETNQVNVPLSIQNTTNNARNVIFLRADGESNVAMASSIDSGGAGGNAISTTGRLENNYNQTVALFLSTSSRTIYLNGGNSATNTTSTTTSGLNQIAIGARYSGSFGAFFNGQAAEAAIWDTDLTAAEITSLSKGFKPYRIRPQSLVFYAPLIRNLQDTRGGRTITNNNTATVAVHPRVY